MKLKFNNKLIRTQSGKILTFKGIEPNQIKYGLLYNWWATQYQGTNSTDILASEWNYVSFSKLNYVEGLSELDEPTNLYVDGVLFDKVETNPPSPGQWVFYYTGDGSYQLEVRGLNDEDFTLESDGYVQTNVTIGYSIIPDAMDSKGWSVPNNTDWSTLKSKITNYSELKESGLTWWNYPNDGTTNQYNFNARQSGDRSALYGNFNFIYNGLEEYGEIGIWSSSEFDLDDGNCLFIPNTGTWADVSQTLKPVGASIRIVRATTASDPTTDGASCDPYIGNDGKVYRTVRIGTQVWIADNLAETKWSDGSWIQGYDGGTYTIITDENWVALTTPALCAYNNQPELYM